MASSEIQVLLIRSIMTAGMRIETSGASWDEMELGSGGEIPFVLVGGSVPCSKRLQCLKGGTGSLKSRSKGLSRCR